MVRVRGWGEGLGIITTYTQVGNALGIHQIFL